jgi:DNA-binding XRE family transcriptional regulator
VRRPGIGIAIDRHKFKQLREAALLERIDLSEATKDTELRQLARDNGVPWEGKDRAVLTADLIAARVLLPRHVGISRDAIAKIENGDRARPKISTLRLLIDTLNVALIRRGRDPIGVEDLYRRENGDAGPGPVTAETLNADTVPGPAGGH